MGVSTDAMLVYGYVWGDEHDLFRSVSDDDEDRDEDEDDDSSGEWEEIIAARRGIANPWDSYPQIIERLPYPDRERRGKEWTDEHRAELDAWHAAKKAIAEEYGVDIDSHGSGEWSCPVVKIAGAGHTAARGYPHKLTVGDLAVDPGWDGKLQRFVTDLGIDTSEAKGPGWFIASWWG
jgi:hypothetical protein